MSRPAKLPGQEEASNLGYILYSSNSERSQATYSKNGLYLTVRDDNTAVLGGIKGLVRIIVDRFEFPNSNFHIFEKQIRTLLPLDETELIPKATFINDQESLLRKALYVAAEDSYQCEIVDSHLTAVKIGENKEFKSKQDWLDDRIQAWITDGVKIK